MRTIVLIGVIGAITASASIALAHNTPQAWTEAKAGRMVVREGALRMPAGERGLLAQELRESVRLYKALLLATSHMENSDIQAVYQTLLARYESALHKVENGLAIAAASCRGTGPAVQRTRFRHFRCAVTSDALEIPTAELEPGDRDLPLVIEGPSRILGPYQATLDVHVTGKSSMAYRQAA
jgi:hypothetical protein